MADAVTMAHPPPSAAPRAAAGAGFVCLVLGAGRADIEAGLSPAATALDLSVGIAFAVAAWSAPLRPWHRILVGAVAVSWLLASLVDVSALPHALLAVSLLAFAQSSTADTLAPPERRTVLGWGAVGVGALAVVNAWGQPGVAVVFLAVALVRSVSAARGPDRGWWRWYPALAPVALALVVGGGWLLSRLAPSAHRAEPTLMAYELLLIAVAVGHVLAARGVGDDLSRRLERLVAEQLSTGAAGSLAGLEPVLGRTVGDPQLRIRLIGSPGEGGRPAQPTGSGHIVVALDGGADVDGGAVAVVDARAAVLDDPRTGWAVERAVRVVARAEREQRRQELLVARLRAAQALEVEAKEGERRALADVLSAEVLTEIAAARRAVQELGTARASATFGVVDTELAAAGREISAIVAGVSPFPLGAGALPAALARLTETSPIPAYLEVHGEVATDAAGETALWYTCREGLANAVKHSGASRVGITVAAVGDRVVATTTDDGRGEVDPAGHGLVGLDGRLRAAGGGLRVTSTGSGSSLEAWVPRVEPVDHAAQPRRAAAPSRASRSRADAGPAPSRSPGEPVRSPSDLLLTVAGVAAIGVTMAALAFDELVAAGRWGRQAGLAAGGHVLLWVAAAVLGSALAWSLRTRRFRLAAGLGLVAVGGLPPVWVWVSSVPTRPAVVALALPPLLVPAVGRVVVARTRAEPGWQLPVAECLALVAVALHGALYDPFRDPGCTAVCDPVGAAVPGGPGTAAVLGLVAVLTWLASVVVLGLARKAVRGSWTTDDAVVVTGLVAVVGIPSAMTANRLEAGAVDVGVVAAGLAAALALTVLVVAVRAARVSSRTARLVDRLEDATAAGHPDGLLHGARFRMPDSDRWVDAEGRDSEPASVGIVLPHGVGPAATVAVGDSIRVRARHGPPVELGAAEVLVLSSARVLACTRARERDLEAATRSLTDAAVVEQRRIAGDLHDGAQQRLVGVLMHLRLAVPDADPDPVVAAAAGHVERALDALRELAGSESELVRSAPPPSRSPRLEEVACAPSSPMT